MTPDNPDIPSKLARRMIQEARESAIESIHSVLCSMPEHFCKEEIREMERLTNEKYDLREALYDRGEKQWDTNVAVTMVIRGETARIPQ